MDKTNVAVGMSQARDVFFNELSVYPFGDSRETQRRVLLYSDVLKKCGNLGHTKVRYEYELSALMIAENKSLSDFCYENYRKPELNTAINLILTTQRKPYIDDDSNQEKQFVEHDFQLEVDGSKCFGYGFVAAYLSNTFVIGFSSKDTWIQHCFNLIIVDKGNNTPRPVFCISRTEHFEESDFVDWYVSVFNVSYSKRVGEGCIHLRDDHGKDILFDFACKIIKEDFIVEVVNSLPFAPKAKHFIEEIHNDGTILIRLTNTDRGLGLSVRTVGKNKIQTAFFAKLLRERYGC